MRDRYLEVTFRKGKVLAAYLYLPRPAGDHSVKTVTAAPGILIDFGADDSVIGIEIASPGQSPSTRSTRFWRKLGNRASAPRR